MVQFIFFRPPIDEGEIRAAAMVDSKKAGAVTAWRDRRLRQAFLRHIFYRLD
jgi:hypothetical protein